MNYSQRLKQRTIYYRTGIITILTGGGLFFLIIVLAIANVYFQRMTQLGILALFLIAFGVILSVVFSRLGWNQSAIIDFFLNQLSVISTIIGFFCAGVVFANEGESKLVLLSFLLIIIGIVLANLGMKFSSYPPSNND